MDTPIHLKDLSDRNQAFPGQNNNNTVTTYGLVGFAHRQICFLQNVNNSTYNISLLEIAAGGFDHNSIDIFFADPFHPI